MNVAQTIEAAEAASLASPSDAAPGLTAPSRTWQCLAPPRSDTSGYHKKLERVLAQMGSVYLLDDILAAIAAGTMQSFAFGNSWLIAQVNQLPRATVMDWLAVVGDLDDCRVLHDQAIDFARQHDISLIRAYGRRGWMPDARERGWRPITTNVVYHKEL